MSAAKSITDFPELMDCWRLSNYGSYVNNLYAADRGLTTLRGCPKKVLGFVDFSFNKLTSLEGIPEEIAGDVHIHHNEITSLKDIHKQIRKMNGHFFAHSNNIASRVLGLMLIDGVTSIKLGDGQLDQILNRHLGKGRAGMLMAQEELIDAGLEEFAQL